MCKSEDEAEESSKTVGTEKLKERRPLSEVILGMTSKCLLEERRYEEGT